MPAVSLREGELVVKEASSGFFAGDSTAKTDVKGRAQGRLYLTNQRLVFHRTSQLAGFFLGIFYLLLAKGNYAFDIPLDSVAQVCRFKQGLRKNVFLKVVTAEGATYVFGTRYPRWASAISDSLLVNFGKANVVEPV